MAYLAYSRDQELQDINQKLNVLGKQYEAETQDFSAITFKQSSLRTDFDEKESQRNLFTAIGVAAALGFSIRCWLYEP